MFASPRLPEVPVIPPAPVELDPGVGIPGVVLAKPVDPDPLGLMSDGLNEADGLLKLDAN